MRMAAKNDGALMPTTLPPTTNRSNQPPGRRAAINPMGMPKATARANATNANKNVAGKAFHSKAVTDAGCT